MLDQTKLSAFRQAILQGGMNVSELAKYVGVTRPTAYEYIHYFESEGFIKTPELQGKNVIIEAKNESFEKIRHRIDQSIDWDSEAWEEMFQSFKQSHKRSKSRKVNLMHKNYRYRLAQINNFIVRILEYEKGITYLRSIAGLKQHEIDSLNKSSTKCLKLLKGIQEDTFRIDPEHKEQITEFFTSNILKAYH